MKLAAGATVPPMALAKAGGGEVKIGGGGKWQLFIVYRGKHCPICRTYLKGLDGMLDDIRAADIDLVVASGDTREKAETEVKEEGWRFPVGYGMTLDQMRALGLYISHPRTPPDTDCDFPEPGMFVINPEGKAQVIDVSNAPFARPDLKMVVNGIKMTRERGFPVRGTAD
ncbi:MAG: redoxin domain-containing protein [Proteobacteria bacterium]|nr:redoxin domain-containing protein [Pseudomonadota bacterium]